MSKEWITVLPWGKKLEVVVGETVREALHRHNLIIETPCGGQGTCGQCRLKVFRPGEEEKSVMACRYVVSNGLHIELPPELINLKRKEKLNALAVNFLVKPAISKQLMEIDAPSLDDQRDFWRRLNEVLTVNNSPRLNLLRSLPSLCQDNYWLTAVLADNKLLALEKGDTTAQLYGLAVDIGTTTVVGNLLNLKNGEKMAVSSRINTQNAFGADVIARIDYARQNSKNLQLLQKKIVTVINEIIIELCQDGGVDSQQIYTLLVVGNTCMVHLFLGIDPASLATSPYIAVTTGPVEVQAAELGIAINAEGQILTLPGVSAFVGSDTVGAILATRIYRYPGKKLLIDIGTNGELVLGSKGRLMSTSTAAGPAFEGAQIRDGMRAAPGAIENISIENSQVHIKVIGNELPRGICGSGLVDAVASLCRAGIIEPSGRIRSSSRRDSLPEELKQRLVEGSEGLEFVLAFPSESANGRHIAITQQDIRELQLAKGALRAGVEILLERLHVQVAELDQILLAGAFANYLKKESAAAIGLWPEFPLEKVKPVGNAAGIGAQMALLSIDERATAYRLAPQVEYIELGADKHFQKRFLASMSFPVS